MLRSRSASPLRDELFYHREHGARRAKIHRLLRFIQIREKDSLNQSCINLLPPRLPSVASAISVVKTKAEKIVRILLAAGGANQIQARDVQLEGSLMKKIPQSFQCRGSRGACLTMREVGTARCAVRTPQRGVPTSVRYVFALIFGLAAVSATSFAQTTDSVAEREVQRRQTAIPEGEAALGRGKSAMKAKNYTLAHEEFKTAVSYLPDSVVSGKA